jgi:hypothetical protein
MEKVQADGTLGRASLPVLAPPGARRSCASPPYVSRQPLPARPPQGKKASWKATRLGRRAVVP